MYLVLVLQWLLQRKQNGADQLDADAVPGISENDGEDEKLTKAEKKQAAIESKQQKKDAKEAKKREKAAAKAEAKAAKAAKKSKGKKK